MRGPPDPGMRKAAPARTASNSQNPLNLRNTDLSESRLDIQASRLRRLYFFAHETAVTIAALAYAGGPR
jgi:hypothetical protein